MIWTMAAEVGLNDVVVIGDDAPRRIVGVSRGLGSGKLVLPDILKFRFAGGGAFACEMRSWLLVDRHPEPGPATIWREDPRTAGRDAERTSAHVVVVEDGARVLYVDTGRDRIAPLTRFVRAADGMYRERGSWVQHGARYLTAGYRKVLFG